MSDIFTPDFLLKFIYNETNTLENEMIVNELKTDTDLAQIYHELLESIAILDMLKFSNIACTSHKILELKV